MRPLLVLASLVVVAASCATTDGDVRVVGTGASTSSDGERPDPPASSAPPSSTLEWERCGELDCATLTVPLDHDDPGAGTIDLFVKRRPASDRGDRIGTLVVNPGGPGVPGTLMVDQAEVQFSDDLLDRFDIVAWDPRGTGRSSPVDCVDDLDPYFAADPTPDDEAEKQRLIELAKEWNRGCEERSGRVLPHVSTQDTARDLDLLRAALGEEQLTYFGFSYGSFLGATYATLFPHRVRAMVLDGADDPTADAVTRAKQKIVGLERQLDKLLDDCSRDRRCAFHNGGDAGPAFDRLMASLDRRPLPGPPGRPNIGQGIAYYAVVSALYDESYWDVLEEALADAQRGDGRLLLRLYDDYVQRNDDGTWTNAFEGLIAINCLDDPGPSDPGFAEQFAAELRPITPRLADWAAYSYNCTFWPEPAAPALQLDGAGAGPIVVVGTTGDPVTPIEASTNMAAALEEGRLVTVEAERHTGYGVNRCVVRAVDRYLIDLRLPDEGLVCG